MLRPESKTGRLSGLAVLASAALIAAGCGSNQNNNFAKRIDQRLMTYDGSFFPTVGLQVPVLKNPGPLDLQDALKRGSDEIGTSGISGLEIRSMAMIECAAGAIALNAHPDSDRAQSIDQGIQALAEGNMHVGEALAAHYRSDSKNENYELGKASQAYSNADSYCRDNVVVDGEAFIPVAAEG